jgi:diguanylate cyclase (GGDEF)-like protein
MAEFTPAELDPFFDVVTFQPLGSATDLTNCDREPIHLSGAIQPHGVLLGVREDDFSVQRASANTQAHLGLEPAQLLGTPLARAVGENAAQRLRFALAQPGDVGADDQLICQPPGGGFYEMTWHRIGGLVLVELEPAEGTVPVPDAEHFAGALRSLVALQSIDDLERLCRTAAVEVKRLTGYDRVMIYRFHPDDHGEVVAEQRENEMEPFLGLHYPASDIPRQARKLYLLNRLRVIADVDYEPVPLLGPPGTDQEPPVNLSVAGLRSVSPIHLAYLRNMGVKATLTLSLIRGTRLWGMIACHHRTAKRIDAQSRADCQLFAGVLSQQVVNVEDAERRVYNRKLAQVQRQILPRISTAQSVAGALVTDLPSPLELTAADGMVVHIDGHTMSVGSVPPADAVASLLVWLCAAEVPSELVCDDLSRRFAPFAPYLEQAAGVLALPLSPAYQDYVLWFRGERVRTVRWAGDPSKPMTGSMDAEPEDPSVAQLGPRQSFAVWLEEIRGQSLPWLLAEVQSAHRLAQAIPTIQLTKARNRLAQRAQRDPLTCLPNQSLFLTQTAHALERAQGTGTVALVRIDLDHLGRLHEPFGRSDGDRLVRLAAQRLSATIGEQDVLAHLGGDDFTVLCENTTVDRTAQLASRIVKNLRVPFVLADRRVLATASVGFAVADRDATADSLLSAAHTAMSRMKHWGRDGAVPFYS